jgi:thiamine-phosphate pyrophosphorylase
MTLDVRLLAIAGPPFLTADSIVDSCSAAQAGGVTAVQVRLKGTPANEVLRITQQLIASLSIPVYVNDRADVALAARAAGVHLGAADISPVLVRKFAPRPMRIGVSVGTLEEAGDALRADVDYWSIGSIYRTDTKSDAGNPIGIAGFRALAPKAPRGMPVIAIGGIRQSNAGDVLRAGAQGIAVISAIFGVPDAEKAARELRDIVESESPG